MRDTSTETNISSIIILLLLLVDNLYFNYSDLKLRVSELLGIMMCVFLVLQRFSRKRELRYPPASGYFLLFLAVSSISMNGLAPNVLTEGLRFQLHILVLFLTGVALYNRLFFVSKERIERPVFLAADILLAYGGLQIVVYIVTGYCLSFGMERWADINSFISYRQDFIDPNAISAFSENAPWVRPPSIFAEPVFFGLFCTWLIIIYALKSRICPQEERPKWLLRLLFSSMLSIFIASRALWISVGIVLAYFFLLRNGKKPIKELLVFAGSAIAIMYFVGSIAGINFYSGIIEGRFSYDYIESDTRTLFWGAQLSGVPDSPWIGRGRGMTHELVTTLVPEAYDVDAQAVGGYSFWITLLYDAGIVGMLSFFFFVGAVLRKNSSNLKLEMTEVNPYRYGFVGMLLFGLLLGPMLSCGIFWFGLVILWLSVNMSESPDNLEMNVGRP